MPTIIQIEINNLVYYDSIIDVRQTYLTVCNNAVWCLGEIAQNKNKEIIRPFIG